MSIKELAYAALMVDQHWRDRKLNYDAVSHAFATYITEKMHQEALLGAFQEGYEVAYHEAGHAVACYYLNVKFKRIVFPGETNADFPRVEFGKSEKKKLKRALKLKDKKYIKKRIIICLAGMLAEEKIIRWPRNKAEKLEAYNRLHAHGHNDVTRACDLAANVSNGPWKSKYNFYNKAEAGAKKLWETPSLWYAVEQLALELDARADFYLDGENEISYYWVAKIIKEAIGKKGRGISKGIVSEVDNFLFLPPISNLPCEMCSPPSSLQDRLRTL
jgi:hypothetical protein